MNCLIIEASTEKVSFFIKTENINKENVLPGSYSASLLASRIDSFLRRYKLTKDDFDVLVAGSGPGSFTGLRIAFSVIKGLALAWRKKVIVVESFYAVAEKVKGKIQAEIAVIADARRNLVYGAVYSLSKEGIKRKAKAGLYQPEDFSKSNKNCEFVTYNRTIKEKIVSLNSKIKLYSFLEYPEAKFLYPQAERKFKKKQFAALDKLIPLYIYKQDAQVRKTNIPARMA